MTALRLKHAKFLFHKVLASSATTLGEIAESRTLLSGGKVAGLNAYPTNLQRAISGHRNDWLEMDCCTSRSELDDLVSEPILCNKLNVLLVGKALWFSL